MPEAPDPDDAPVAWARCIVRDLTGSYGGPTGKMTIDLAGSAKVATLVDEVAKQTNIAPDKFVISLQHCAGGEELILNDYLNRSLVEVGLETGAQSRNNLFITEAKPRRKQRSGAGLESGDHAGRTSPVAASSGGAEGGSDSAPAYTYASGLIKSNETGHVGLVNQAMTCYLNSLLQTLFMTPEFRNAMYSWEYEGTREDSAKSIPYQLQKLFVNMQTTERLAVETTELTYSFGWDSSEAWQQHDIQELCRVMFDALEVTFKDTEQHDLISRLYEGKMIDYVKCLECGTEKDREDTYLDIPLPIRLFGATTAFGSVEEALRGFVKPETLDGNNQYHCDNCGRKCDAHKGLKFKTFPYLLTLHLKRFDFDYQTLHRIKLNDRVSFPEILNLNDFVSDVAGCAHPATDGGDGARSDDTSTTDSGTVLDDEAAHPAAASAAATHNMTDGDPGQEDEGIDCSTDSETRANNWRNAVRGPYEYELFSIMIHAGSASGGHYYAYIKDFAKQEWFCFNDQSVSPVTQDDIRRTYGGGTRTSSYSSSTNAYMLMYRRIDRERNKLPLTKDHFPEGIQKLLVRMREGEDEERANKERERSMCKLTLFGVHPVLKTTVSNAFHVHKDMSLEEATELGWKMLEFDKHVPLSRCRLVRYDELNDAIEESLEQHAGHTMEEVLGGVRSTYKLDLMLEWRAEDAQFEVYSAGDTTLQVLRVSVSDGRVSGPTPLRVSLSQSVTELRQALGLSDSGRLCLARYCGELRPLLHPERSLKLEGFHRNSRVFVAEDDADDLDQPFTSSGFFRVCDRHEHTISLQVIVPNTDQETLDRLAIPSLDQMSISAALAAAAAPSGGAAPPEQADSPPVSPEPTGGDELLGGGSSDQSASEDSSVTDSERTLIGGEQPTGAGGGGSLPATPSNSPAGSDYQSMLSPQEEGYKGVEGGDDDPSDAPYAAAADDDAPAAAAAAAVGQPPIRRYFVVEKSAPHENGLLWDVRLDNRITLGGFKKEIETLINVHRDYFKILKIYTSNQEFECTRLDDQLMTHGDNVTFVARLSRRLRDGEVRGKVYKLEPNATEPSKFLFEWILRKGMTIAQAKREILAEQKSRLGVDIPMNRCRLRKKSWKNPGKIYLDTYKFNDQVPLYPNWEIFLQELPSAEEVEGDGQLSLFCRRFHPGTYTLDDLHEVTLPTSTPEALLAALSRHSGVPADNIRLAKPPGSFPNDFNALLAPTELDWLANVTALDTWPLNILEDGHVLYYKDDAEPLAELSDQQRREISTRETARLQARSALSSSISSTSSSATAPRRERGLKIHVDIQPAAGD
ncbi:ubiquitin carboxyl-terminal hydrolase 47-like isoform X1 [Amphibalanus amphitrite]|uniref:ubiquitin carboxyl-terminal hydrolase 47-like isoform X1 n=2 Tax=Amphibalanus amphitrite TaxID=1232801 RepID=UPI001C909578|nr:ubiquitin carboxyl-terminal hydrolase 47-like isoform X1 [Amphibalanus amphitrite]XP_043218155.1 ubiquitin carboxyl-terminal hydrolase 47-like isoform X1 [Amphibalanus amphitrite]XP_043218156.1 ubiquitin carboxyl-terminal hydrolase 47-like isoform X1 [Amphibalanus amphitrite]XP_043218158.1 ubiquitin carboxyl-terminal hydrolase 47-like isoform X1 [Amphibalanus amphitrite]